MGTGPIYLQLCSEAAVQGYFHRFAGETVWCDLRLDHGAVATHRRGPELRWPDSLWMPIYDGPGELAGGIERIRSERGDRGGYRITHEDGEAFVISHDGGIIRRLAPEAPAPDELAASHLTRTLGAPLALAFALREIYLLHASAVRSTDGAVFALTACSGGGKSTLAAAARSDPRSGLARVADDQLPVRLGRNPAALPHFPQLKLSPAEQYPDEAPHSVTFRALVELEVDASCRTAELTRESPGGAIQLLVRATVAAKLFDRELLARHFDACASAALALPVWRLRTPRDLGRLGESLATLAGMPA
jgi:hypothetical protein